MSVMDSEARTLRARGAALSRSRPSDDPELLRVRRDLAANRLSAHIQEVLASAPKLTDEQLVGIASLFRANLARPQQGHADLGLVDTSPNEIGGDV